MNFVLMVFLWKGIRSGGCYVFKRWLRYKTVIPFPKPWILKEEEILNKWKLSRYLSPCLGFEVFRGRKKQCTEKQNEEGCQKEQMLKY